MILSTIRPLESLGIFLWASIKLKWNTIKYFNAERVSCSCKVIGRTLLVVPPIWIVCSSWLNNTDSASLERALWFARRKWRLDELDLNMKTRDSTASIRGDLWAFRKDTVRNNNNNTISCCVRLNRNSTMDHQQDSREFSEVSERLERWVKTNFNASNRLVSFSPSTNYSIY